MLVRRASVPAGSGHAQSGIPSGIRSGRVASPLPDRISSCPWPPTDGRPGAERKADPSSGRTARQRARGASAPGCGTRAARDRLRSGRAPRLRPRRFHFGRVADVQPTRRGRTRCGCGGGGGGGGGVWARVGSGLLRLWGGRAAGVGRLRGRGAARARGGSGLFRGWSGGAARNGAGRPCPGREAGVRCGHGRGGAGEVRRTNGRYGCGVWWVGRVGICRTAGCGGADRAHGGGGADVPGGGQGWLPNPDLPCHDVESGRARSTSLTRLRSPIRFCRTCLVPAPIPPSIGSAHRIWSGLRW